MKCLVIEDDMVMQRLLYRLLSLNGCSVSIATTIESAIERVRIEQPDLVISELSVYGESVTEFVQQLPQISPRSVLAILTVSLHSEDADRSRESGVIHYYTKPVTAAIIKRLIELASFDRLISKGMP